MKRLIRGELFSRFPLLAKLAELSRREIEKFINKSHENACKLVYCKDFAGLKQKPQCGQRLILFLNRGTKICRTYI